MSDYTVPRGAKRDLRFLLREVANGPLIDQFDFTDGLDHDQWPVVRFYTGVNGTGTEVTALFVEDITAESIDSASHKDPTGSTGVWRQSVGTYFDRVVPQNALAFTVYYMRVAFEPTDGNAKVEDLTVEVVDPGDIDPNSEVSVGDVTRTWTTVLDPEIIEGIIDDAWDEVYGRLEVKGIKDPEGYFVAHGGTPRIIKRAVIERAQCFISTLDLSSSRPPVKSIAEGPDRITFRGPNDTSFSDPCSGWMAKVDGWLKKNAPGRQPMYGVVTKRVGHTVNPTGLDADGYEPI